MLKIGLIDSGMGGLSVLKGLIENNVNAEYHYLYDNKYHPYGSKSESELVAIGYSNMKKLLDIGVNIIIIACNTLTSRAIDKLRLMFDNIPIVGVEPPIKPATLKCDNILLLATPATLKSDRVVDMIHNNTNKNFYFPDMSCLANMVENNYENKKIIYDFLTESLKKYTNIEGVVVGCTHYNFVVPELKKIFPNCQIFSNIDGVVKRTKYIINKNNFENSSYLQIKLYLTGKDLSLEKKYYICRYLDFGTQFTCQNQD